MADVHDRERLIGYAAGSLGAAETAALEAHLAGCAACRAELAEWQTLADGVRREVQARPAEVPPVAPLLERLPARRPPIARLAVLAGALVILGLAALVAWPDRPAPTVEPPAPTVVDDPGAQTRPSAIARAATATPRQPTAPPTTEPPTTVPPTTAPTDISPAAAADSSGVAIGRATATVPPTVTPLPTATPPPTVRPADTKPPPSATPVPPTLTPLPLTGVVAGTVRGPDGSPQVEVRVVALPQPGSGPSARVERFSGPDGGYELVLPPGTWIVMAHTRVQPFQWWPGRDNPFDAGQIDVGPATQQTGVDFDLVSADGLVTGRVLRPDGTPVESAIVMAVPADGAPGQPPRGPAAMTELGGEYQLYLAPGRYLLAAAPSPWRATLSWWPDGGPIDTAQPVDVAADGSRTVDLTLPPATP